MPKTKETDDQSDGEAAMRYFLRTAGIDLPPWTQHWTIPEGNRTGKTVPGQDNFEADFAWVPQRVLFEVQGAGHSNYFNYRRDWERHNLLTLWGYRVFYATPDQITTDPEKIISLLRSALKGKDNE